MVHFCEKFFVQNYTRKFPSVKVSEVFIGSQSRGHVSLMGASMGEYVVDIGFDLTMDFCELVEERLLIGPLFQAIGFDPNRCPPDVMSYQLLFVLISVDYMGIYGIDNYEPLIEAMPDNFPRNMYRIVIDIHSQEEQIMIFHIFSKSSFPPSLKQKTIAFLSSFSLLAHKQAGKISNFPTLLNAFPTTASHASTLALLHILPYRPTHPPTHSHASTHTVQCIHHVAI
ncbi:Protein of unknown function [Cotesia congregata]|uniref:Uncharacterized protein n=1 Tax=Cotesia congregata TaxID=51543 RepID=A0A8J2EAV2_COTCN|nr:Protein of unknown function [Cotesia congregata]